MIYISLAAYRDPVLQSTIDHALKMADNPDQIEFGCFITVLDAPGEEKFLVSNDHNGQVKYEIDIAGKWFSVCKARNLANQFIEPKHKYVLQIDSHTRFEPGWDTWLISQIEQTNDPKAIIAGYPKPWWPRGTKEDSYSLAENSYFYVPHFNDVHIEETTFTHYGSKGEFLIGYELKPVHAFQKRKVGNLEPAWYTSGCFFFSYANYAVTVKQPEWILFWGEEVYNSMRAFTHGWNVYIPTKVPIHHLFPGYDTLGPGAKDSPSLFMNKPSQDFPDIWNPEKIKSTDRVIDAIASGRIGDEYFGTERPIEQLYEFLGYNMAEMFPQWREEYWVKKAK